MFIICLLHQQRRHSSHTVFALCYLTALHWPYFYGLQPIYRPSLHRSCSDVGQLLC
nr:MAG TPA: hypothetical protein [Caudoviricetes sp.]